MSANKFSKESLYVIIFGFAIYIILVLYVYATRGTGFNIGWTLAQLVTLPLSCFIAYLLFMQIFGRNRAAVRLISAIMMSILGYAGTTFARAEATNSVFYRVFSMNFFAIAGLCTGIVVLIEVLYRVNKRREV